MTKIKIHYSWDYREVEKMVNDFIATHEVTDLQFQTSGNGTTGRTFAVMITYKE